MTNNNDNSNDDDLMRRARDTLKKADQLRDKINNKPPSKIKTFVSNNIFLNTTIKSCKTIWRWLGPIGVFIIWILRKIYHGLRWAAFAREGGEFVRDENGLLDFSIKRFSKVLVGTVVALFLLHVALSALYYYSTAFEETVYVTGKQEIETGELYQFGGCTSLPCSTEADNGKFYLIETSVYFPRLFYPEEDVFANIPQQDAACRVEGYGIYFRSLRWLYKSAQLYQHITRVSCRPYTEQETTRAVGDGNIIADGDSID